MNPYVHGKQTYDSKRDKYHGYEIQEHLDILKEKYAQREAVRKKIRAMKQKEEEGENNDDGNTNGNGNDKDGKKEQEYASDSDSD